MVLLGSFSECNDVLPAGVSGRTHCTVRRLLVCDLDLASHLGNDNQRNSVFRHLSCGPFIALLLSVVYNAKTV